MEGTAQDKVRNPLLITGASGSMGKVATQAMAQEGYPILMACRNLQKGETVRQEILKAVPEAQLELIELDLSRQTSVREMVARLDGRKLSGIFNNAGIISRRYSLTEDGIEHSMAVNYLNPTLLTRLLLPNLEEKGHIVNMVSISRFISRLTIDWPEQGAENFQQLRTYANGKMAFLYFTLGLARRYPQFIVNMSDPGVVNSNMISMGRWFDPLADIFFRPFIKTPEQGAQSALNALHATEGIHYYVGKGYKPVPKRYQESPLVDELWEQATQQLNL